MTVNLLLPHPVLNWDAKIYKAYVYMHIHIYICILKKVYVEMAKSIKLTFK